MAKIAKKKKKTHQSKPDLSHLRHSSSPESDIRRKLRQRNSTHPVVMGKTHELVVAERRTEKKLRVKNINNHSLNYSRVDSVPKPIPARPPSRGQSREPRREPRRQSRNRRGRRRGSVEESSSSSSSSEEESGEEKKPYKKRRKISGCDEVWSDEEEEDDDGDDEEDVRVSSGSDHRKERRRNAGSEAMDTKQSKPSYSTLGIQLPDREQLELLLDKLQKKDTYGVYAEPVDPEELPDYNEVIEHPMDFGTIRKKLASGIYRNLEQFESDVFLVCTNAMQYNAPETVYFKQAHSIQELARKNFQSLRIDNQRSEAELKSEENAKENAKSDDLVKSPINKSSCRMSQEPIGSDFSSGATLATAGDAINLSIHAADTERHTADIERPIAVDDVVDVNTSTNENIVEETEEAEEQLPVVEKGLPSKVEKKSFVQDENRRATYNISNQPVVRPESILTTFDGENKELVAAELQADHSYARSLACFAAPLGPVAWRVASRRIQQALPVGVKFGRGWVGEYEPFPTPILVFRNCIQKQMGTQLQDAVESRKNDRKREWLKCMQDDMQPNLRTSNTSEEKPGLFGISETRPIANATHHQRNPSRMIFPQCNSAPKKVDLNCSSFENASSVDSASPRQQVEHRSEEKLGPGMKSIVTSMHQQKNPLSLNLVKFNDALKPVDLNSLSGSVAVASQKHIERNVETGILKPPEIVSRNRNSGEGVKQAEHNAITARLPNGKGTVDSDCHRVNSFSDFVSNQQARVPTYIPRENQEHGASNPVQMKSMLTTKAQNWQKPSNIATIDTPEVSPSIPSTRVGDSCAASAAARAWMSLGTSQFKPTVSTTPPRVHIPASPQYNSPQELSQFAFRKETSVSGGFRLQPENRFPPQQVILPVQLNNDPRFQNNRQMVFPQLVTTDLSRFQVQSPWRGLVPHAQANKKQHMLPPDLNVSFQSSGSPTGQSSVRLVDSQQPDLALQL